MLKSGSRGDDVTALQRLLKLRGADPGEIDGVFGPKTEAAVEAFQGKAGLDVDGIAGPKTMEALKASALGSSAPAEKPKVPKLTRGLFRRKKP